VVKKESEELGMKKMFKKNRKINTIEGYAVCACPMASCHCTCSCACAQLGLPEATAALNLRNGRRDSNASLLSVNRR